MTMIIRENSLVNIKQGKSKPCSQTNQTNEVNQKLYLSLINNLLQLVNVNSTRTHLTF